ncbi:GTP cyclohydrolase 1-like isoform X1 [Aristolochia californica]|uniref:GTP cyclohydrolase 1-like isoform X1 n=1 Tax=Aristolochia californica TaxID=171875 RepID=UPI0035DC7B7B
MGALGVELLDEPETVSKLFPVDLELEETLGTGGIEEAVKVLLQGLEEDVTREGLLKTPLRVAKALREGTTGYRQKVKDIVQGALFPEAGLDNGAGLAGGAGGLVVVRDIDLFSYCECCLLPFKVQCYAGYVPSGQRVVGLSKLPRVADVFAKRLQDPQRLANEICVALHDNIKPTGVAVMLVCWHIKFPSLEETTHIPTHPTKDPMPGWVPISVFSGSGVFENDNSDAWDDYLPLLKFQGIKVERNATLEQSWCPSRSLEFPLSNGHLMKNLFNSGTLSKEPTSYPTMMNAVVSILHSLGEDPSRKELVNTPHRFVQWLMKFKRTNLETKINGFNLDASLGGISGTVSYDQKKVQSELNLPFWSQCEHHLLPFHGVVHICFFHSGEIETVDRSFLQTVVQLYGCQLQVQERLTRQIAETISSIFHLLGVMVVVEASHICMISRGVEKVGSSTATIAVMGQFAADPKAKAAFLETISCSTAFQGQ